MKKVLSLMVICLFIVGCKKSQSDALKFKEDYESLNGQSSYRTVLIDSKNPYVYTTAEEIVKKIENGETFFLYIGDKQCPWCRSVIEKSIEVANDYSIDVIYYVPIWDDNHNEILRDKYKLDENNELVLLNEGTKAYNKLLEYFDEYLEEYTLKDSEGNVVSVGEKRIFAPNFIYVKKGEVRAIIEGISELQTDARGELTSEILEDEQKLFNDFFYLDMYCDSKC